MVVVTCPWLSVQSRFHLKLHVGDGKAQQGCMHMTVTAFDANPDSCCGERCCFWLAYRE